MTYRDDAHDSLRALVDDSETSNPVLPVPLQLAAERRTGAGITGEMTESFLHAVFHLGGAGRE
jgi:hypothetical protein